MDCHEAEFKAPKKGVMAGPAYWLDINEIANGQRLDVAARDRRKPRGGDVRESQRTRAIGADREIISKEST